MMFGTQDSHRVQPPLPPPGLFPPVPKKSHMVRNILIGLVVLFVIIAVASNKDGGPSSNTGSGVVADAGVNTPVRDGSFEFVVTSVERGVATVGDNPYLSKSAQGQYTIVHLSITNIDDKPQSFAPGNQKVFDAAGREFSNDFAAAINLQAETSLLAEINPGNTVTAAVVFDLPAGSTAQTIELHDSMFSGGVVVKLD